MIEIPINTEPRSKKMAIWLSELQAATSITTERRNGYWIDFHSDELRRLLGGKYRQVVDESVELGYVEVNGRYSVNRFSKSYRLAKPHRRHHSKSYPCKVNRIRLEESDATGRKLASWFHAADVPHVQSRWVGYLVRQIRAQNWYAVRCRYRRFHSSFTALPRITRRAIKLCSDPVAELDVKNCQSLILGLLAEQNREHRQNTNTRNTPYGAQNEFLKLAEHGQIYDQMLGMMNGQMLFDWIPEEHRHKYARNRPIHRNDVKKQFIVMQFADVPVMKRLPIWPVFQERFGQMAEFIEDYKLQYGYQALARDCQRLESRIMVDTVSAEIDRPIILIHDGIICRRRDKDYVADSIRSGFGRYGLDVAIK